MDGYLYGISTMKMVLNFFSTAISKEFGEKPLVLVVNLLLLKMLFFIKEKYIGYM